MYDGAWNNSTGHREKVKGTSKPVSGTYICTSGSNTGTNCNIKVDGATYITIDGYSVLTVEATQQTSGGRAVGNGDSGGPVLTNTSVSGEIKAAGIISAGSGNVSCSGTDSTSCYHTVYYVPIQDAQRGGGVVTA